MKYEMRIYYNLNREGTSALAVRECSSLLVATQLARDYARHGFEHVTSNMFRRQMIRWILPHNISQIDIVEMD